MGVVLAREGIFSAQLRAGASAQCHRTLLTQAGTTPNTGPCAVQARLLLPVFPTEQRVPTVTAEHHEGQRVPLLRQVFNKTLQ